MSLVCSRCRNPVPEGLNQCRSCNRGFSAPLVCSACGDLVAQGASSCDRCAVGGVMQLFNQGHDRLGGGDGAVTLFDAGRFGVVSEVSVPDDVVDLLGDIARTGQGLMRLASRLASYEHTPTTREVVRGCRDLAMRLQEELETRRGVRR